MKNSLKLRLAIVAIISMCALTQNCRAADEATLASPYVFTDEKAVVKIAAPLAATEIAYELKTITREGFGPTKSGSARAENGAIEIAPLGEGIHTIELQSTPPQTLRFLALEPPAPLEAKKLRKALPQSAAKLLAGRPFKILAMGDSVTSTGDYESLLVKMLARATGNRQISFVDRSYSGRSIDASVREWKNDGPSNQPDLGLIMYGLNDQITNVPLDAYLEQYAWLARELKALGADCAFLQPTPDIGIPVLDEQRKPDSNPPSYIVRTLGFGEALRPLARELKVPLAETFSALWGTGGASLEDSARSLWPSFPPGYAKQFQSLLETDNKGDTIHPNVLGHLQIARAVFEALNGAEKLPIWQWSAQTRWTASGAQSVLSARNVSRVRRAGRLEAVAPTDTVLESAPVAYDLAPGQSIQISVGWTQAKTPEDLLQYPANRYLSLQTPLVPIMDFSNEAGKNRSRVYGVTAPFETQGSLRRARQIVNGNRLNVEYAAAGEKGAIPIEIPAGSEVGRLPILRKIEGANASGWIAGEAVYTRYGAARSGEAIADGDLNEWEGVPRIPLGETVQARSWQQPLDNRARPEDAYLRWAFKSGKQGIYFSARATGDLSRDNFTIYFDPRAPELLGTVGRYYWISGKLLKNNRLELSQGETSTSAPEMKGAWKKTASGADLEFFVPYAAFDATAWPQSGDLGLSIVWIHRDVEGKRTELLWSENGHRWNPRWFGVVRRTDETNPKLPFMVRVF